MEEVVVELNGMVLEVKDVGLKKVDE